MSRIAVIGSGISGLAAAYYLSRKHQVFLFEKEPRLGGHTNTIAVETERGVLPIDTGFIVHNDRTYPNFIKLMEELGVDTAPSDMSFAVMCRRTGFEYSSRGLNGFFAQRANLLRPHQYELFREIIRFNRTAPKLLATPSIPTMTLGDVIDQGRYSSLFTERYLYPMASAVWSMPVSSIRQFPALTMIRFFDNHGMLGINTHPKWKVIRGGSNRYIAPITQPYMDRIQTSAAIRCVKRTEEDVTLCFDDREPLTFDHAVFACHGDQVLPLLESASPAEREILQWFRTSRNEACLHTDSSLLPRRPQARASWNYNLSAYGESTTVTYHMNRLQSLPVKENYCVSLNAGADIDPKKVLRRIIYHHPIYDQKTIQAQARWHEISGVNRTHFCGAYWFYGFHEDGLNSALRVAQALDVPC